MSLPATSMKFSCLRTHNDAGIRRDILAVFSVPANCIRAACMIGEHFFQVFDGNCGSGILNELGKVCLAEACGTASRRNFQFSNFPMQRVIAMNQHAVF